MQQQQHGTRNANPRRQTTTITIANYCYTQQQHTVHTPCPVLHSHKIRPERDPPIPRGGGRSRNNGDGMRRDYSSPPEAARRRARARARVRYASHDDTTGRLSPSTEAYRERRTIHHGERAATHHTPLFSFSCGSELSRLCDGWMNRARVTAIQGGKAVGTMQLGARQLRGEIQCLTSVGAFLH